ncbi:hypothetical protein TREMEDRAFT_58605 [Tremella mesenterica DSM 1558]|uniref:uncharacterized protein n=1 Tax=Tremella mesenterica (strain ATCC 24925 / CBS 8224 / DSM 1558 / NBRC 9311 / NRRL Y-6157 / RJB 2259-6 / UBC 559-6) TaxID=578456 RepID=UPI0003F4A0E9|nr:uncharacterized protein TREMEDRAFT_58605 [Tremella mesenterica DSM 1558]EIW72443.1 hypothetical protein TREMEDRAFT_58605 [Tremella mesenterica DSM 1558]
MDIANSRGSSSPLSSLTPTPPPSEPAETGNGNSTEVRVGDVLLLARFETTRLRCDPNSRLWISGPESDKKQIYSALDNRSSLMAMYKAVFIDRSGKIFRKQSQSAGVTARDWVGQADSDSVAALEVKFKDWNPYVVEQVRETEVELRRLKVKDAGTTLVNIKALDPWDIETRTGTRGLLPQQGIPPGTERVRKVETLGLETLNALLEGNSIQGPYWPITSAGNKQNNSTSSGQTISAATVAGASDQSYWEQVKPGKTVVSVPYYRLTLARRDTLDGEWRKLNKEEYDGETWMDSETRSTRNSEVVFCDDGKVQWPELAAKLYEVVVCDTHIYEKEDKTGQTIFYMDQEGTIQSGEEGNTRKLAAKLGGWISFRCITKDRVTLGLRKLEPNDKRDLKRPRSHGAASQTLDGHIGRWHFSTYMESDKIIPETDRVVRKGYFDRALGWDGAWPSGAPGTPTA